ncbi:Polysaccharide deacetylase [Oceanospirillum multiglobuliferum]|uniref:NodB homology domain-containing protein n=1 Tax=Oceanospirillum multiglobuliferum TaxID=64969 RepID=A0A1T4L9U6_9GAMM|nr:polysaccharide deacetylase family protein [Oceanospirillum multiglobuliferum]OPX56742.1 hypothetical protein BTE48_02335 [Oceanospirillum multiglobuliferum]SJZ51373.1 Polysaccharide deacetylase [Oceanospirillum multiglobuliferum]
MRNFKLLQFIPLLLLLNLLSTNTYAARHAVVLQYQHISDRTPPSRSTPKQDFIEHLNYIEQKGYTVWPLEKVIDALKKKRTIPDKTLAITFDNAYVSVYEEAMPELARRQMPFTVFVAAAPILKEHPLYMSWAQLRKIQKAGGTIGSMGITGSNFAKPMPEELKTEQLARIEKDIQLNEIALEKYLGVKPNLLAYPEGQTDESIEKLVSKMGYSAFGLHQGPASRYTSLAYLPRFMATGSANNINNLSVKLSSLPLPVRKVKAEKRILPNTEKYPELNVELLSGSYVLSGLRCQNSEGLPVTSYLTDGKRPGFILKSKLSEKIGAIEYICTLPHDKSSRSYWFSHTWIRPDAEGRW